MAIQTYKGYDYIVFWNDQMGFYCGYVRVPKSHPYHKKVQKTKEVLGGKTIMMGYEDLDIECHGGLTFGEKITKEDKDKYPQGFTPGIWIGWDYGHLGDSTKLFKGKEHSFKEVKGECQNVIEQLINSK